MPKISAPTVAEHRHAQRRALLTAAEDIIRESGVDAVTPRAVGARTGLARSSVYEYFRSRDALLAALAAEAFGAWVAELQSVLAETPPGRARLHRYVEATVHMAADGRHVLARQLQDAGIAPTSLDEIMRMHEDLTAPLRNVLADLGVGDPAAEAALVQGLVNAGVQLVDHGVPAETVTADIIRVLDRGVGT